MSKRPHLSLAFRSDQWILVLVFCVSFFVLGCKETTVQQPATKEGQAKEAVSPPTESPTVLGEEETVSLPVQSIADEPTVELSKPSVLFDGKNLDYWEEIEFGGEGEVSIADGILDFEMGDPFTGIASTLEDLPKTNYEVSLEARKVDGTDFFCGLTFPVADSHCTLILGGWGGSVGAWLDDKQIINADIAGKRISLRGDTALCEPLGIASFQTRAQYRKVELRTIKVKEDLEDSKDSGK